jgi:ABC-type glycerol-3-phosphate transport system substrate-binding protein
MSEPKKVDRRKFIYAGLGAVALIAIGAATYVAMNPPVVTVTTSTTVPTTSVVTTTSVATTTVPTTSMITTTSVTTVTTTPKIDKLTALIQKGGMGPPAEIMFKMYEKASGVKMILDPIPWEAQFEKQMTEFAAKSTTYDLMPLQVGWRATMGEFFEDLAPYIRKFGPSEEFIKEKLAGNWALGQYAGIQRGIPMRAGLGELFYYRKDLYEKYKLSLPRNMKELEENMKLLKEKEGIYGWCQELGGPDNIWEVSHGWMMAHGAIDIDDTKIPPQVTPYDPNGIKFAEILAYWKRWFDMGLLPEGILSYGIMDTLGTFQQGKLAHATMYAPRVILVEDPKQSVVAGKTGYSPLFWDMYKEDSVGRRMDHFGGWSFGINSFIAPERKEAAYQALLFLLDYNAQLRAAVDGANVPTRIDVFDDPEFKARFPEDWRNAHKITAPTLRPSISTKPHAQLLKAFADEVTEALLGHKTPEEATKAIWKKEEEIIKSTYG